MNKKQLIVALGAVVVIVILLGLETTHTDYPDASIDLSIFGKYIGSDIPCSPYPSIGILAYIGNYKCHLAIATFIIGVFLIYSLRDKKKD